MSDEKVPKGVPTPLQKMVREAFQGIIDEEFMVSSDHPYTCRCESCQKWWKLMGPDPDGGEYGPFTKEEVERDE